MGYEDLAKLERKNPTARVRVTLSQAEFESTARDAISIIGLMVNAGNCDFVKAEKI